jgi:hypothetical protein
MKKTVINCVTAVLCVIVVCITSTISIGKISNARIEASKVKSSSTGSSETTDANGDTVATEQTVVTDASGETITGAQQEGTTASLGGASSTETKGTASSSGGTTAKATSSKPSTQAEILNYFNTAINKVKPSAKSLVKNYEKNSQAGTFELSGPFKLFSGVINSLVQSNMGEKKDDHNRSLATKADIQKYFPVENETWSSKLTTANIDSATLAESGGKYVVTVKIKADAASASTAHNAGNHGKAFSIVMTQVILDNAGPVKSLLTDSLTIGYRDGKIVATIDPATGHITHVNYYYVWTLNVEKGGTKVSAPFGLEQDFTVNW